MPFQNGHPNYLLHHTEKTKHLMSISHLGSRNPMYGRHPSEHTRSLMRLAHTGTNNHFYGRKHNSLTRRKMREAHLGIPLSDMHRKALSISHKGWKPSPECIRKSLGHRGMSSLESSMLSLIRKNRLPYKFVGDGKFFIENKCPDFVNTNGMKVAIEVYCKLHKEEFRGGVDLWMKNRTEIFNRYGWKLLFFESKDIRNSEQILRRYS